MNKFNFTKAAINLLPTPEAGKRAEYYDTKVSGLRLRVTSSGVKTFSMRKRVKHGEPERVTLGRYPEMTIEQARRKAAEIATLILEGKNPAEVKRQHKADPTFSDLFTEYLTHHSKPRKKTWMEDEHKYNAYLAKPLGKKKLTSIIKQDIAKIHSTITLSGRAIAANRVLALISSIYGWAISAGLVTDNPVIGIKRNKEHSRDRFLQSDELPLFFQALSEEPNKTIRDYILISLLTGARRSNVLSMRWQDISFERAEWRIDETKNGTPQTVTLSPEVIEILIVRKSYDKSEYVFPGTGKSGHLEEPKKGWDRILQRAGIQNLRIHDLRRTLGSWQARTGTSLAIIGKSLNHKSHASTLVYARLDLDPVRDSVNRATNAIVKAAGVKKVTKIENITSDIGEYTDLSIINNLRRLYKSKDSLLIYIGELVEEIYKEEKIFVDFIDYDSDYEALLLQAESLTVRYHNVKARITDFENTIVKSISKGEKGKLKVTKIEETSNPMTKGAYKFHETQKKIMAHNANKVRHFAGNQAKELIYGWYETDSINLSGQPLKTIAHSYSLRLKDEYSLEFKESTIKTWLEKRNKKT